MEAGAMVVVWGDGELVAIDYDEEAYGPLTDAEVDEIATVLVTSTKLGFIIQRLTEQVMEHREAGRLQAAANASAVLAAVVARTSGAIH
jgi:hypothetical protein